MPEDIKELKNELEQLREYHRRIAEWQQLGETIFKAPCKTFRYAVVFALGEWWADRPWRNRDAL